MRISDWSSDVCSSDLDEGRRYRREPKAPAGTPQAARRLLAASKPFLATVVEAYLRNRAITDLRKGDPLSFHPHCYYRPSQGDPPGTRPAWPAMIAAVTDLDGGVTGVQIGRAPCRERWC